MRVLLTSLALFLLSTHAVAQTPADTAIVSDIDLLREQISLLEARNEIGTEYTSDFKNFVWVSLTAVYALFAAIAALGVYFNKKFSEREIERFKSYVNAHIVETNEKVTQKLRIEIVNHLAEAEKEFRSSSEKRFTDIDRKIESVRKSARDDFQLLRLDNLLKLIKERIEDKSTYHYLTIIEIREAISIAKRLASYHLDDLVESLRIALSRYSDLSASEAGELIDMIQNLPDKYALEAEGLTTIIKEKRSKVTDPT